MGENSFLPTASQDLKGRRGVLYQYKYTSKTDGQAVTLEVLRNHFYSLLPVGVLGMATERWPRIGKPMCKIKFSKT